MKNIPFLIPVLIILLVLMLADLRNVHGVSVGGNVVWTKKEAKQMDQMLNQIDKKNKIIAVGINKYFSGLFSILC